jgi:hypothetical protein
MDESPNPDENTGAQLGRFRHPDKKGPGGFSGRWLEMLLESSIIPTQGFSVGTVTDDMPHAVPMQPRRTRPAHFLASL